jgi:hypothetical protein
VHRKIEFLVILNFWIDLIVQGGEEASGEDESSTEEGDHTYESLYDVIGSSARLDRVGQTETDVVVGNNNEQQQEQHYEGDDVSYDDDLFDDSFDSASEDDDKGTLTVSYLFSPFIILPG